MFKQSLLFYSFIFVFVISGISINQQLKSEPKENNGAVTQEDTAMDKPAEQVYKNIQVLKGMQASKLHSTMRFIANSLGVRCDFCHVKADKGPWPMEKDDKKTKETAREMITMMRKINDDNFEGRQVVSCATCHNGSTKPVSYPPFSTMRYDIPVNKDSLPDAGSIVSKYINAVGGKTAFDKIKTRIIKGEIQSNGTKQPAEIQQAGDRKSIDDCVGDARALRRRPARQRPYHRRRAKQRSQERSAKSETVPERLHDPPLRGDELVDAAADADQHEGADREAKQRLREEREFVLGLGVVHRLQSLAIAMPGRGYAAESRGCARWAH